jgi:hypothetical protein
VKSLHYTDSQNAAASITIPAQEGEENRVVAVCGVLRAGSDNFGDVTLFYKVSGTTRAGACAGWTSLEDVLLYGGIGYPSRQPLVAVTPPATGVPEYAAGANMLLCLPDIWWPQQITLTLFPSSGMTIDSWSIAYEARSVIARQNLLRTPGKPGRTRSPSA